jgi:hypothetical protein
MLLPVPGGYGQCTLLPDAYITNKSTELLVSIIPTAVTSYNVDGIIERNGFELNRDDSKDDRPFYISV